MKHLKPYKLFESNIEEFEDNIHDILIDLEDTGLFQIEIDRTRKDKEDSSIKGYTETFIEVQIRRPFGSSPRVIKDIPVPPGGKYDGHLFFWFEVKDVIIRLNQWYYENSIHEFTAGDSPFRMFMGGIEFGVGWNKPYDFDKVGDLISFTSLRIEMKL